MCKEKAVKLLPLTNRMSKEDAEYVKNVAGMSGGFTPGMEKNLDIIAERFNKKPEAKVAKVAKADTDKGNK